MQGFDPNFKDFPDFLLTVTEDIWEMRGLGEKTREYYHPQVISRDALGIAHGEPALRERITQSLVSFPDSQLLGEDVIWSGSDQLGMLGSHRVVTQARHTGPGMFGPATGKPVQFRTITDRYGKNGRIHDEWSVCDTGAILRQLEIDPLDWAKRRLPYLDVETQPLQPQKDAIGPYTGRGNDNQWGAAYSDILARLMAGEMAAISRQYDRACHLSYPGGEDAHGREAADAFWMGLRASFPSAQFEIHHQVALEDTLLPPRAAVRWSLSGRHDGWGRYGAPTGAAVYVSGIAHAEFGPWGLRREWVVVDDAAIWLQIAAGS